MLSLIGALGLGLGASATGPGCVVPDYCIVIHTKGTDWCVNVEDAMMWPIGNPEMTEPVGADRGGSPVGCRCMNDGEVLILRQFVPADTYAELVEELEEAARFACADAVPPGYDHNCLIPDDMLGPTFTKPYHGGRTTDCVGSCAYTSEPPFGSCGPDPNPWECNEDGSGETGGGTEIETDSEPETDTGDESGGPGGVIDGRRTP